jgi:Aerotolerance regulator N-terminal/von Willebrand factor type A domain
MGLTFLQPAFLLGALATAVPILIHLIYRRRALVHRFPAVRFLLLADKRTARKFRLHQWLLLALRLLAILLLALILARPLLTGEDVQAAAALPPQATVILVDNSLSMQYRDQDTARLQRAKALIQHLVQGMRGRDTVAVMPLLAPSAAAPTPALLSADTARVEKELEAILPSHAAVDMHDGFARAFALLRQSTTAQRRLIVLSDFTVHGWQDFDLAQFSLLPEQVELRFIRLGTPQRDANVLIESIEFAEQPFIEQVPLEVKVFIRNRSAETIRHLRLDMLVDQHKIGQQLVDLQPDAQIAVPFRLSAPTAGLHWGEMRLESDRFAEDDRFYFAMRTVAPARILIVDGDPGTSLVASEIFYLLSALQPSGALRQPVFHPTPVTWEGLAQERLTDYQVIVLCNVEAIAPQLRQSLYQFVASGGGLLFFAGHRVDAARYNAMFYQSDTRLLPAALGQPIQPTTPSEIETFDDGHTALSLFTNELRILQHGLFYRYFSLEGQHQAPDVQTLLTLQDGHPLLVEKSVGSGQVMFFTSSADRDWTDLPTRTAYVPLLHGIVSYLANLEAASQRPNVFMPDPIVLQGRPEDASATLSLHTADGQQRLVRYTADATGVHASFADYTVPGLYRVETPKGPDVVTVNATRAESNFDKLQQDDLQTRWRPLHLVLDEEESLQPDTIDMTRSSKELASLLILALAGILALENVYANRL